jgi:hypothetical protein
MAHSRVNPFLVYLVRLHCCVPHLVSFFVTSSRYPHFKLALVPLLFSFAYGAWGHEYQVPHCWSLSDLGRKHIARRFLSHANSASSQLCILITLFERAQCLSAVNSPDSALLVLLVRLPASCGACAAGRRTCTHIEIANETIRIIVDECGDAKACSYIHFICMEV